MSVQCAITCGYCRESDYWNYPGPHNARDFQRTLPKGWILGPDDSGAPLAERVMGICPECRAFELPDAQGNRFAVNAVQRCVFNVATLDGAHFGEIRYFLRHPTFHGPNAPMGQLAELAVRIWKRFAAA